MKSFMKKIGILVGINIVYLLFLSGCFLLPIEPIVKNVESSLEIWVDVKDPYEVDYAIFDKSTLYWDSFSDMIWANMATVSGSNSLKQAVKLEWYVVNDAPWDNLVAAIYYRDTAPKVSYSRYWNINIGFLKILFSFISLSDIRFLMYWIVIILLVWLLHRVTKLLGLRGTIPIIVAFMMTSLELHAMSLSFFGDIVVMLSFMIILTYLHHDNINKYYKQVNCIFMVIGSLTFAAGPFVVPVLTVGMCLVLWMQLESEKTNKIILCKQIVLNSVWWITGYIASMLMKQVLSKIVIGNQDGVSEALMWFGSEMGVKDRLSVLGAKLIRVFTPIGIKVPFLLLLICVLVVMCFKWRRKSGKTLFLAFIALYPFFWVLIVSRHSIHAFTSNLFAVSFYAITSILLNHIDFEKRKEAGKFD